MKTYQNVVDYWLAFVSHLDLDIKVGEIYLDAIEPNEGSIAEKGDC